MPDRRRHAKRALATALVTSVAIALAACQSANSGGENTSEEEFYKGKTVEILVPYGPGGGTDTVARFLAPLLSKHIPGQPNIQVINRPGAGTMTGANEYAKTKADGLTWFMSGAPTTTNYILEAPEVQYSYKDWVPIAGLPQGNVTYISAQTGIKDATQLANLDRELILAELGEGGVSTLRILALTLFGTKFKVLSGYESGGAARVALERGEVDIYGESTPSYVRQVVPLVEEGKVYPMFSMGYMGKDGTVGRDPAASDVPTVAEVYEKIYGKAPGGQEWDAYKVLLNATGTLQKILWIHKDAPPAAIEALKKGIESLKNDPEYKEGLKIDGVLAGYELVTGRELEELIKTITNPDPATVQWLKDFEEKLKQSG